MREKLIMALLTVTCMSSIATAEKQTLVESEYSCSTGLKIEFYDGAHGVYRMKADGEKKQVQISVSKDSEKNLISGVIIDTKLEQVIGKVSFFRKALHFDTAVQNLICISK